MYVHLWTRGTTLGVGILFTHMKGRDGNALTTSKVQQFRWTDLINKESCNTSEDIDNTVRKQHSSESFIPPSPRPLVL